MAKVNNNLSGLLHSLSGNQKKNGQQNSGLVVSGPRVAANTRSLQSGMRATSIDGKHVATGIAFGRHATSRNTVSASGTDWARLLEHTASGGFLSAIGGSTGLGSISGIGSLISGIASLFGTGVKGTVAPLQSFHLPASQNQAITIGATGNSGGPLSSASLQDHSSEIAQAVKVALLHSNSLIDVLSEL